MVFFLAFIFAFIGTVIFTPLSILLAKKFDVLDYPRARKVHRKPLPRWGGIGIYFGFFISIFLLYELAPAFKQLLSFEHKSISLLKQLSGIIFGGSLVFILGLIDDKKPIRAITKLLTQIIAAYIAMDYGVRIYGLTIPLFGNFHNLPIIFGQIITIFWLIGFMNTINLADGLDGLAAGIGAIASATFCIVALLQCTGSSVFLIKQLNLSAILAITLTGACLGFLVWNFYPAKLFMGDSGALFIGFILATTSVIGTLKTTAMISIFIPITVVALPILDVALSMFRRLRKGMGIMEPDKEHIHHRLLNFGWSQREVVLLMYVVTFILSIGSILLTVTKWRA
ncbi:MAG: undecaprenyl/decaprenyl-phosphate alpha-N-acetylglucosaminyl 1-phosphate transferase [Elusimicrobia bacterium]|nr:undecaprenyl/decaprenyl-phosphate alpha-N-acetylglucosaminyl 1-phosphate transferase [Candidatus Liberimonas magnetica]